MFNHAVRRNTRHEGRSVADGDGRPISRRSAPLVEVTPAIPRGICVVREVVQDKTMLGLHFLFHCIKAWLGLILGFLKALEELGLIIGVLWFTNTIELDFSEYTMF